MHYRMCTILKWRIQCLIKKSQFWQEFNIWKIKGRNTHNDKRLDKYIFQTINTHTTYYCDIMFRKFVFYIQCYKICLNKWNVQIKQKATNQHIKHQSNTHIILTHVMLYLLTHALKKQVFIKYCQVVSKYLY